MKINELNKREINIVIDLYLEHKHEFYESKYLTIEDFYEQCCHRCDKCDNIVYYLDNCEECLVEEENEFGEFEANRDYYLYGI